MASMATDPIAADRPGPWSLVWRVALTLAVALVSGAHFARHQQPGLALACAALPLVLTLRIRWSLTVVRLGAVAAAGLWSVTTADLLRYRLSAGLPWARLVVILGAVTLVCLLAARALGHGGVGRRWFGRGSARAPAAAFGLVTVVLAVVQLKVPRPMLLAERLWVGGGWLEILALASYAALVTDKMLDPAATARWRRRIWGLFSAVFFAQLALGLAGVELCLMNPGTLHLPVPALIAAGPIYRGEHFFMLVLFSVTVLLVGPAWCSHLCYVGAWDSAAAHGRKKKPAVLPRWHGEARLAMTVAVLGAALGLRLAGVSSSVAFGLALAFGLVGVALMLLWSRRAGLMTHCTVYCPVGLWAVWLGKLSPFRLTIARGCDGCGRCRTTCRYGALTAEDIARHKPGITCTLCGDCIASCRGGWLRYRFFGLSPDTARALFLVLAVSAHAASLGLARI